MFTIVSSILFLIIFFIVLIINPMMAGWLAIHGILLVGIFLPLLPWINRARKQQKRWKTIVLAILPLFLLYGSFVSYSAHRRWKLSCGFNPPLILTLLGQTHSDGKTSLHLSDALLEKDRSQENPLTEWRLKGSVRSPGDFNLKSSSCQKTVEIEWKNLSSRSITLNDLPQTPFSLLRPGKSYEVRFKAQPQSLIYLLDGFPKVIHINQTPTDLLEIPSNLLESCREMREGIVLVNFRDPNVLEHHARAVLDETRIQAQDVSMIGRGVVRIILSTNSKILLQELSKNPEILRIDEECGG